PRRVWLVRVEPVTATGFGLEVARVSRVGLELLAELGHEHPQVVGGVLEPRSPYLRQELMLSDQAALVASEYLEQVPLGGAEADVALRSSYSLRDQIDGEVRRRDERRLAGAVDASKGGADAGEELVHPEGLGHIVVSTGVERGDFDCLGTPG